MKHIATLMLTGLFLCLNLGAQNTELNATNVIIRGRIIDNSNAKPLYGADVEINKLTQSSDLDGKFEFSLPKGTYALSIQLDGFAELILEDIEANEPINTIGDIRMSPKTESVGQVNVSVKRMQNTEEALITAKRIAPN
jgi:hypothetical protein